MSALVAMARAGRRPTIIDKIQHEDCPETLAAMVEALRARGDLTEEAKVAAKYRWAELVRKGGRK